MDNDREHLRLLAIFHYILGGMVALVACIPIIHLILSLIPLLIGLLATAADSANRGSASAVGIPFFLMSLIFMLIPLSMIIIGWTIAFCIIKAGRYLDQVKNRIFCFAIACIECMVFPLGTVLGVFAIIVLNKESVMDLFDKE